jgi:hypothetical protein
LVVFVFVYVSFINRALFGNALFGNALFGNTLFGNTLFGNTLFGNTLFGNTLFGNAFMLLKIVFPPGVLSLHLILSTSPSNWREALSLLSFSPLSFLFQSPR